MYHKLCLKCLNCGKRLDPGGLLEHDSEVCQAVPPLHILKAKLINRSRTARDVIPSYSVLEVGPDKDLRRYEGGKGEND